MNRRHDDLIMHSTKKINFYLGLATVAGEQGTCPRAQVGAVLVGDDRVLGLGYNGSPRGTPHCLQIGCLMETGFSIPGTIANLDGTFTDNSTRKDSCVRSVHAEANAIINAAYSGSRTRGAYLFTTHKPCANCLKLILNAGIMGAYYKIDYVDPRTDNLLALAPEFRLVRID